MGVVYANLSLLACRCRVIVRVLLNVQRLEV